jgi:hypothetical protein
MKSDSNSCSPQNWGARGARNYLRKKFNSLLNQKILATTAAMIIFLLLSGPAVVAAPQQLPLVAETSNSANATPQTKVIYISTQSAQASDRHPGTLASPLKTISAGLAIATKNQSQGISTKLLIFPGVYREQLEVSAPPADTQAEIALVAIAGNGSVIVSGSDVWQQWRRWQNTQIYTHAWPFDWGFFGNPWQKEYNIDLPKIVQRGEIVFIDGKLVKQVLAFDQLEAGNFYVDQRQNLLYVYPPDSIDMNQALVEVAIRKSLLNLKGAQNFSVHGLTFQHTAGNFNAAVTISNSRNVLLEDCQLLWNNWAAMSLRISKDITVQRSLIAHNGEKGVASDRVTRLRFTDVESSYNNWRGAWGKFYDWDAGEKFFSLRDAVFTRYKAVNNLSAGLWLDTDNQNVLIDSALIANNAVVGLFLEAGTGPITLRNSIIRDNYQIGPNYLQTAGLFSWAAANVTVENNLFSGNGAAQIGIRDPSSREVKDSDTGKITTVVSQNWQIRGNVIRNTDSRQRLLLTLKAKPFLETLVSDRNHWQAVDYTSAFQLDRQQLTFPRWQSQQNQDKNSLFTVEPEKSDRS